MSDLPHRDFIAGGVVAALGGTLALAGCEWLCALRGKGGGATALELAGLAPLVKTSEFCGDFPPLSEPSLKCVLHLPRSRSRQ